MTVKTKLVVGGVAAAVAFFAWRKLGRAATPTQAAPVETIDPYPGVTPSGTWADYIKNKLKRATVQILGAEEIGGAGTTSGPLAPSPFTYGEADS